MACVAQPTLVYLYGPPAAGKLTIAERLVPLTGYRLFHNHLTVNAVRSVFEFGSRPFTDVLHRLRLDVLATAMEAGISVIFTNNSAWGSPDARTRFQTFADTCADEVHKAGGRTLFVQLTAAPEVLERRLGNTSRLDHAKLIDVARLRELLAQLDPTPLHESDLTIDTGVLAPEAAAQRVAAAAAAA
jgi:predicted kinase